MVVVGISRVQIHANGSVGSRNVFDRQKRVAVAKIDRIIMFENVVQKIFVVVGFGKLPPFNSRMRRSG